TDGDPCDVDGECGNNSCTLRVAVCIDQRDPNLPTCHPPSHLQKLHVNSKLAAAVPTPLDSACGSFIDLPIPLHRVHNGTQAGRLRLPANATAPTGTNPLRDRDAFVLECLPRTTPCASTTTTTTAPTTTTTSSTSTSTTTTSIQGTTTTTSTTTTTVPCPAGETDCSGTCVDTNTDPNHCGDCSTVCPAGDTCATGICVPPTVAGQCLPTSSLSILLQGSAVSAFVPNGRWNAATPNVQLVPLEG